MTREEIINLAKGLCTDFKCESDTMVDFCNSIIRELETASENNTLNEIKAEIEQIIGEHNLDDYDFCSGLICARNIINKYEAKSKDIKAQDIEMQATEFLAEARACAERNNNPER